MKPKVTRNNQIETCFYTVLGMTCASCVDNIQRNLSKIDGIQSVLVALLAQRAEVKYDPTKIDPKQIENHINDLGFQAELLQTADRGMEMIDLSVNSQFVFRQK